MSESPSAEEERMAKAEMVRSLGTRSGIEVSAMGLGCWPIGGPFWWDGRPVGYGEVDDAESTRAIQRALDLGVTLFDTADVYGCGHSEEVLGRALAGRTDGVVVATKFGYTFDPRSRTITGEDASPEYIRSACEASLRRLGTEYIDLYQFHLAKYDYDAAVAVRDVLEELVAEGKVRFYGWSHDDPRGARVFAEGPHCTAAQHGLSLVEDNRPMLEVCEELGLASVNRSPLAGGFLTGKFHAGSELPEDDVRKEWTPEWMSDSRARLAAVREALTADGRTLAGGALGWIWARSEVTVPIPGFKTVAQVEENAAAMSFGPLPPEQMAAVESALGRDGNAVRPGIPADTA